jgi:hypothetical protein
VREEWLFDRERDETFCVFAEQCARGVVTATSNPPREGDEKEREDGVVRMGGHGEEKM